MPGTRKLGKPTDQRMAMLRQQVTDLMTYGKLTTTVTRAKELKPLAEKMITLGQGRDLLAAGHGGLHAAGVQEIGQDRKSTRLNSSH